MAKEMEIFWCFYAIEHLNKNINSEIDVLKDKIMRLKTKKRDLRSKETN